jgi:Zn-dependent protease with chaperone function
VLAYPSPTTLRFVVFLAALLSAGALVGTWLHNQLLFDDWLEAVVRCEAEALAQTRTALLAITVQLVSSALLRSREHDADLRAARAAGDQGDSRPLWLVRVRRLGPRSIRNADIAERMKHQMQPLLLLLSTRQTGRLPRRGGE